MPQNERYPGESPREFAMRQAVQDGGKRLPPHPSRIAAPPHPEPGGLVDVISDTGGYARRGLDGYMQHPTYTPRRGPVYQGPEMSDAMLRGRGMVDAYGSGNVFRPGAGPSAPGHVASREDVNIGGRPVRHPLNRGLF